MKYADFTMKQLMDHKYMIALVDNGIILKNGRELECGRFRYDVEYNCDDINYDILYVFYAVDNPDKVEFSLRSRYVPMGE